jgi:hypothetical protein
MHRAFVSLSWKKKLWNWCIENGLLHQPFVLFHDDWWWFNSTYIHCHYRSLVLFGTKILTQSNHERHCLFSFDFIRNTAPTIHSSSIWLFSIPSFMLFSNFSFCFSSILYLQLWERKRKTTVMFGNDVITA